MAATHEPTDHPFLDRLSRALGPRYAVERLLGEGGMGRVYLARDLTLERRVAVKVIPPELATAVAVERFHREAKILADLSHPNVMPIYDFGDSEGLLYYTMQYVEGETLKARIERGPIPPAAALAIARQLLEALSEVHRRGIVHRDIKPSNVMLVGERVLLTDFGIARRPAPRGETLTEVDVVPGTPSYMAPEATWGEVTTRSDLYTAGMVIYEALTGQQWQGFSRPEDAEWSGVPARVRRPLARALALAPAERWPDVARFRHALHGGVKRPPIAQAAAVAVLVVVIARIWPGIRPFSRTEPQGSQLLLAVPALDYAGPGEASWVADSITARIRRSLDGPDVRVVESRLGRRRGAELAGTISVSGDTVRVALAAESSALPAVRPSALSDWRAAADSAALRVWHEVWKRLAERGPVPAKVIPRDPLAFAHFVHGERLFALARWSDAARAYTSAEERDPSCLLCAFRLHDVERWQSIAPDENRYRRLLTHLDSFPPHYQAVIRAAVAPTVSRVDSLRAVVKRWPDFGTAWFHLAEELFHRGPLIGHPRRDAEEAYVQVTRLNPTFAPAWHHLAWLRTAEGDRAGAEVALANLQRAGASEDAYSAAFTAFVSVSYAWRFQPSDSARAFTELVLANPDIVGFPDLGAGARFLVGFDAPEGAIALAQLLEDRDVSPTTTRSAMIAEVFGNVALGRPRAARAVLERLLAAYYSPELALFAAQLDAAFALLGPNDPGALARAATRLEGHLGPYPGAEHRARRAAYLTVLLERELARWTANSARAASISGEPAFGVLLHADSLARHDQVPAALERSLALIGSPDSSATVADPFFRTVHHLMRAEWYAASGNVELAYLELGWYENANIATGYPTGDPGNVEVDWAFGTESGWRRARLRDKAGQRPADACEHYRAMVRLWSGGEPAYAARADTARARRAALACPG